MTAILLAAALSVAPDPPPPTETAAVREEIVVTAERGPETRADVPAAVSVLDRETIDRLPADTLADLLEFLPGFHAFFPHQGAGTAPMVTARGFFGGGEAEYVQLRVDGVAVADPESGLADWRGIRAADIERIEALRGPASSLYGDTALGGVIEVFTRAAPASPAESRLAASAGSFGSASIEGSSRFRVPLAEARIGASLARTDGERAHSAGSRKAGDARVSGTLGGGVWSLSLTGTDLRREDPGALTREEIREDRAGSDPVFRFDREDTRRASWAAAWEREEGSAPLRFAVSGSARETALVRTLWLAPGFPDRTRRDLDTSGILLTAEAGRAFRISGRESRLRFGGEAARETLDGAYRPVGESGETGPLAADASGRRDRAALFVLQDWRPAERVRLIAGLRWDRIRDRFRGTNGGETWDAWSPRLGANVRVGGSRGGPSASMFVQYSRAFKSPTLDQLFDPHPFPNPEGGTLVISNASLAPQRARTWEAGISRAEAGPMEVDLVLYRTDVDDEIDFDPATFRYRNIGSSRHTGLETTARWRGEGRVRPFASWAWTRAEAREGENAGRQLKNIPEHLVRAGVALTLPFGFRSQIAASRMGGRYLDDANRFPLSDAWTVDLRIERSFGPVTARVDVWNAGDARSEEIGYALADFRGGSVPYSYPGGRRSVRAGISIRR